MKRPLLILVILIFTLVLLGLGLLQRGLVILTLPMLVYIASAAVQKPAKPAQLGIKRTIDPERAVQGAPVTVTLRLRNEGEAIPQFTAIDLFSNKIQTENGPTSVMAYFNADETVELSYTIKAFRGAYQSFEVDASAQETLDCFEATASHPNLSPFIIHPEGEPIKSVKIRPPRTHGFAGSIAARRAGTGVDFFTTREYQPGDPLRRINWKQSARDDQHIYTNVFEQEQVTDVGIILDARQRVNLSNRSGTLFEHSVHAAATLAQSFLGDGHRVSLLVYGSGKKRVFPGYGKVQEARILDALSSVAPIVNFALTNFDSLPVRFFPSGSQIVMISPIVMEDIPYINRMRARGYAVMVLSPDPISFEAAAHRDHHSRAYRLAFAERELMLQQLRQSGTLVINWPVNLSLDSILQTAAFNNRAAFGGNRRGA